MARAATSWARAAISAVENVPSHILDFFRGSRISDTHLPQFLNRTPLYVGWSLPVLPQVLPPLLSPFSFSLGWSLPFFTSRALFEPLLAFVLVIWLKLVIEVEEEEVEVVEDEGKYSWDKLSVLICSFMKREVLVATKEYEWLYKKIEKGWPYMFLP